MGNGKIRFGLIGAANISTRFCDAVSKLGNAEVIAVASKTLEKAKKFAEVNGFASASGNMDYYGIYTEMLSRDDIDAVYIATTPNFHYDNCMLALEYGKHVLCEKAMFLNEAEAQAVFAKSRETGLFVMECMWSRFQPAFREACRWIREGMIGDVITATYQIGFRAPEGGRVIAPDLAGGALYDISVYAIEGLHALIGRDVVGVRSLLTYPRNDGVDFTDHIILDFGDNITGNILCSVGIQNFHKGAVVYGSDGMVIVSNPVDSAEVGLKKNDGTEIKSKPDKYPNGFMYEIEDAINCINAGKIESEIMPHKDTILCAKIFDECKK